MGTWQMSPCRNMKFNHGQWNKVIETRDPYRTRARGDLTCNDKLVCNELDWLRKRGEAWQQCLLKETRDLRVFIHLKTSRPVFTQRRNLSVQLNSQNSFSFTLCDAEMFHPRLFFLSKTPVHVPCQHDRPLCCDSVAVSHIVATWFPLGLVRLWLKHLHFGICPVITW